MTSRKRTKREQLCFEAIFNSYSDRITLFDSNKYKDSSVTKETEKWKRDVRLQRHLAVRENREKWKTSNNFHYHHYENIYI